MKAKTSLLIALLLPLANVSAAQPTCGVNDGFSNGPCCTPAGPITLPSFPTFTLQSKAGTFLNCNLEAQMPVITVIAPIQVLCDYWPFNVQVIANGFSVSGLLAGKYARTWTELNPVTVRQVWRFL